MTKFTTVLFALTCLTLSACGEEIAYESAYTNSQSSWLTAKGANGNAYIYRVEVAEEDGSGHLTSLSVAENAVIERAFKHYSDLDFRDGLVTEWTEEQTEVGSHNEGAAALTVDDLYQTCHDTILNKGQDVEITFEVDSRGILKTCTYRPAGCTTDACEVGVGITEVIFMSEMAR